MSKFFNTLIETYNNFNTNKIKKNPIISRYLTSFKSPIRYSSVIEPIRQQSIFKPKLEHLYHYILLSSISVNIGTIIFFMYK